MIAVIDYGMGNLRSVHKALTRLGAQAEIVQQPDELPHADKLILPGVGAFADAIARLRELRLDEAIREFVAGGRPLLGICLGMQMLFDVSYEDGEHKGLGILRGKVVKFGSQGDVMPPRIPHMGWNDLRWQRTGELLHGLEKECFILHIVITRFLPIFRISAQPPNRRARPRPVQRGAFATRSTLRKVIDRVEAAC